MNKTIMREIIIALLICLAILLILAVALYNFIPANKVVPEVIKYTPTSEIQTQLNSEVEDNSKEILMTYEITAQDLENYRKTKDYQPGKANPFAECKEDTGDENTGTGNTNTSNGSTSTGSSNNSQTNQGSGTTSKDNNSSSSGKLFENSSSK